MVAAFLYRSPTSILKSISISTSLFAKSSSPPSQITTFGQLMSSDISSATTITTIMESPFSRPPSCPCCSFLSGGTLFLPWNEDDGDGDIKNEDATNTKLEGASLSADDDIITPEDAWERILAASTKNTEAPGITATDSKQPVLLVDTHGHPHLQSGVQYATTSASAADETKCILDDGVISLTCAVSPIDWQDALGYAAQSPQILPALGVHPWYLGDIMNDIDTIDVDCEDIEHYLKWEWLSELETHLSNHPNLLVGEIGLCKMAKWSREFPKERGGKATALQLQKAVFRKQLELSAKWARPVTIHCVNAHGLFLEVMKDILKEAKESCKDEKDVQEAKKIWRRAFPPAIAMHSFTGTAHHVGEILDFEKEVLYPEEVQAAGRKRRQKKKQSEKTTGEASRGSNKDGSPRDMLFYFGFSHVVNHLMCTSEKARKKGFEAVRSIPTDRLLVESDVHASVDVTLGTAGAVAYAAHVRGGESLEHVSDNTTRNGLRFLSSLGTLSI